MSESARAFRYHDVIHPAPFTVHGDADAGVLESAGEIVAAKLAALIGVENLGLAVEGQSLFKRCHTKVGVHGVTSEISPLCNLYKVAPYFLN